MGTHAGSVMYVDLAGGKMEDQEVFDLMTRVTGKPADLFKDMPYLDWARMFQALHKAVSDAVKVVHDKKN